MIFLIAIKVGTWSVDIDKLNFEMMVCCDCLDRYNLNRITRVQTIYSASCLL
jgi:hypothetical protein